MIRRDMAVNLILYFYAKMYLRFTMDIWVNLMSEWGEERDGDSFWYDERVKMIMRFEWW